MEYLGKVYAKIGGRYVPLEATAEEIDKWKKAYESQPKQLSDEELQEMCIDLPNRTKVLSILRQVRDRTSGGVDLVDAKCIGGDSENQTITLSIPWIPKGFDITIGKMYYLTQRNQQEKE